MNKPVTITVEFASEDQAELFGTFLKRQMLDDFKAKCASYAQAQSYTMQAASENVLRALRSAGMTSR
jgi:hypothetical protein